MDLRQLRYFVGVVDAGSISRAAKLLHVAQPALSNHMANLEADLQVELLHRTSQGVTQTEHGELLYASAQRLLRDFDRIQYEVLALSKEPTGGVAMGCIHSASSILGAKMLRSVIAKYPSIKLSYFSGQSVDVYRRLLSGALDIGVISADEELEDGISSTPFLREELLLAISRNMEHLAEQPEISIEDLGKLPFIFPAASYYSIRGIAQDIFNQHDISPNVLAEIDSMQTLLDLVGEGIGCTIVPWSGIYREVERGDVVLKRICGVDMVRQLSICKPLNRPLPIAAETVHKVLLDTVELLISSGDWRYVELIADT